MSQGLPAVQRCFPPSTGAGLGLLKGLLFDSFSSVVSVCAVPLCSAKVNNAQALNPPSMSSATDSPGMPMNCLKCVTLCFTLIHLVPNPKQGLLVKQREVLTKSCETSEVQDWKRKSCK